MFDKDIATEICSRLAEGESLRGICTDPHMPAESTVRAWAKDDIEGFAAQYARARELGYERLAEEILHIADTPLEGTTITSKEWGEERKTGDMIEHRKLQVDARKWMLAKMLPKVYGDKQQIEHSGAVDIAAGLLAARKRSGLSS